MGLAPQSWRPFARTRGTDAMASEVVCGLVFRLLLPICLAVGECFPLSEGPGEGRGRLGRGRASEQTQITSSRARDPVRGVSSMLWVRKPGAFNSRSGAHEPGLHDQGLNRLASQSWRPARPVLETELSLVTHRNFCGVPSRAQWMRIRLKGSCRPLPRFVQEHPPGPWTQDARAHPEGFYATSAPSRVPAPGGKKERTRVARGSGALKLLALLTQKPLQQNCWTQRLRKRRPSSAPARSRRICNCAGTPRFKRGQREPPGFPGKDLTVFMRPVGREKPPAFRSKDTRGARAWSERGPISPLVEVPH